tara:strand:- start:339 stop:1898 length:1560 start_codon:yes stop_codon:yes gene_type:complete
MGIFSQLTENINRKGGTMTRKAAQQALNMSDRFGQAQNMRAKMPLENMPRNMIGGAVMQPTIPIGSINKPFSQGLPNALMFSEGGPADLLKKLMKSAELSKVEKDLIDALIEQGFSEEDALDKIQSMSNPFNKEQRARRIKVYGKDMARMMLPKGDPRRNFGVSPKDLQKAKELRTKGIPLSRGMGGGLLGIATLLGAALTDEDVRDSLGRFPLYQDPRFRPLGVVSDYLPDGQQLGDFLADEVALPLFGSDEEFQGKGRGPLQLRLQDALFAAQLRGDENFMFEGELYDVEELIDFYGDESRLKQYTFPRDAYVPPELDRGPRFRKPLQLAGGGEVEDLPLGRDIATSRFGPEGVDIPLSQRNAPVLNLLDAIIQESRKNYLNEMENLNSRIARKKASATNEKDLIDVKMLENQRERLRFANFRGQTDASEAMVIKRILSGGGMFAPSEQDIDRANRLIDKYSYLLNQGSPMPDFNNPGALPAMKKGGEVEGVRYSQQSIEFLPADELNISEDLSLMK